MSMGTPINGGGGGDFGVTRRDGAGGNLMTDRGSGRAGMVLSGAEGAERDTD